ncbi:MAG: hypothetical protein ACTSRP_09340 [Candidatus Helarchaeota archaeon]
MNKHYVFILLLITLAPLGILVSHYFENLISDIKEGNINTEEKNIYLPDEWTEDIESYQAILGNAQGNIEDLKDSDGKGISITRTENNFYIEVIFNINFNESKLLDYYDLYIWFEMFSTIPFKDCDINLYYRTVDGRSTDHWEIVPDSHLGGSNHVKLSGVFLQRVFQFKIVGSISYSEKIIIIDRFRILYTHEGNIQPYLKTVPQKWYAVLTYHNEYGSYHYLYFNEEWNLANYDGKEIKQCASQKTYARDAHIHMFIRVYSNEHNGGTVTKIIHDSNNQLYASWYSSDTLKPRDYYAYTALRDFTIAGDTDCWDLRYSKSSPHDYVYYSDNFASNLSFLNNWQKYIPTGNYWDFKIYQKCTRNSGDSMARVVTHLDYVYAKIKVNGYNFRNYDYPQIVDLYATPQQNPIRTDNFSITIGVKPIMSDIKYVSVYLYNNSGPWDLSGYTYQISDYYINDGIYYYTLNLSSSDFPAGEYSAWVRAVDMDRKSTLKRLDFNVNLGGPYIKILFPSNNEIINNLNNYTIRAKISYSTDYYENGVQFKLFRRNGDTYEDINGTWTNMTREGNTDYWNYTIQPKFYGNGDYKLLVRATDSFGTSYAYTFFKFLNRRPQIIFYYPVEGQTLEDVAPFNINISVIDPEGDPYYNVSLMIYNRSNAQIYNNWQNMSRQDTTNYWNFTIDPLMLRNYDNYRIAVRAADYYGYNISEINIYVYRAEPRIEFYGTAYNIYDEDALKGTFTIPIQVTQGGNLIKNFTYAVSRGLFGANYINKTIPYQSGVSNYSFTFNPRDIPYGDGFIFKVYVTNITGNTTLVGTVALNSYYYLANNGSMVNYDFGEISYDYKGVETNYYTDATLPINYYNYRAYNYRIQLPSTVSDALYTQLPSYKIIRNNFIYVPSEIYASELCFQFYEKPEDTDYLHFNMKTPTLKESEEYGQAETGTLENGSEYVSILLELYSNYYFEDVECIYEPAIPPISQPDKYVYKIYILNNSRWIFYSNANFTGEYFSFKWTFAYDKIESGEHVFFKLFGIKVGGAEINFAPLLYSAIGVVGVGVMWFGVFRKPMLKKRFFKKKRWVYYAIGIGLMAGISVGIYFWAATSGTIYQPYKI